MKKLNEFMEWCIALDENMTVGQAGELWNTVWKDK